MSLNLAFKAFFAALFDREKAERIRLALTEGGRVESQPASPATEATATKPAVTSRSEAITLLSALQREARLLDLVQESLDGFDDAQVGAAAREVLRDCQKTLQRMFDITYLAEEDEGQTVAIEPNTSPARMRLVGKSTGSSGVIVHRGWRARRCEVPNWNGRREEAWVLAPSEVEVN